MSGLHMVLNKIFYDSCLTVLWICIGYTKVLNMLGLRCVIHVLNFDRVLSIHRVLNMLVLEYTRIVNMPSLHRVLCKLYFKDSRYLKCLQI